MLDNRPDHEVFERSLRVMDDAVRQRKDADRRAISAPPGPLSRHTGAASTKLSRKRRQRALQHRQRMLGRAEDELVFEIVESIDVIQDQGESSHKKWVYKVSIQRRLRLGQRQRILNR